jgi:hypothetical protein
MPQLRLVLHVQEGYVAMLTISEVTVEDLPEVRRLLKQLGYDLSVAEVGVRFEAVAKAADHSLFVAEQDGQVIGLLQVYARPGSG